jgi:Lrp/AsnC family transcriptional regulator for asnA, asnC and gidA
MDNLDHQLIALLQRNGRASNIELASALDVSEGTVRRRFRNLIDDQVIRVVAVPDPSKLGKLTTALVGLQVDPAHVDPVASELARFDEVQYATITTGAYDIFIWVSLPSPEELAIFLRSRVGGIPGVRRTETFVNLAVKKSPGGSPPAR